MKKVAKTLFMSLIAAAASSAIAGVGNTLISFSTERDCYANGAPVLDGEWYALCWSNQDGGFAGLNSDCTPVNADDKVMILASRAKDGRCPLTIFQIDENCAPVDGEYTVYLLDTRTSATTLAGKGANGGPAKVNSAAIASNFSVSTSGRTAVTVENSEADGITTANGFAIAEGVEVATPASIVAIDPNFSETQVEIRVADMLPSISYKVVYGSEIGKLDSAKIATDGRAYDSAVPVSFYIDKEDAKFFKLDLAK